MFLHLGKECVIPLSDVIGIIDYKSLESDITKNFLDIAQEEGFLLKIVDKDIKSYVITEKIEKDKEGKEVRKSIIYCTNISANTLYKRSKKIYNVKY